MKISVITATYNCGKTLPTTLESLAGQTHREIEHLVMDGGSRDDTMDIVKAWTAHPITAESGPDKGIYDALNKGIAKASGEIVGFLHADDVLQDAHVLEKIAKAFEDTAVQAVYGDLVYVAQDDLEKVIRTWHSGAFHVSRLRSGWMPPHPTFYARRSLYERLGGFDLRYRIAADYDNLLRLLSGSDGQGIRAAYIPEVLVRMRTGGVSNRSLRNILEKSREDLEIARRNRVGGVRTIVLKNLSKISQFWKRA
ncbi:MAG: glycosyltransferase [Oxalobacteraceae bacterium]|nr:MAG: glycosyltransferase [Oxalobacteraceae bacterium]